MANILEEVQRYIADKLNLDSQLSGNCVFLVENMKEIDYEIKKALGKQGIVGLVMTPKAVYQGKYEDLFHAWQLDELEIDIVENPIVNRGKKDGYITGQDASMHLFEVLCPKDGPYEGQLNPVSYEEGEDGGLIVNRCILKTLVYGEEGPGPEPTPTLNMYFVKLLDEVPPLSVQPRDGWMWPTEDGFVVWQNGQAHELGVSFDQISSYVESAISAKADLSAIHGDYIEDADGNKVEADLNARRVIKHHAWYVTDTSPGGYAYSLQPLDSFLSAEYLPDDPSEGDHGFKIELNQTGDNDYAGSLTDYLYLQGEWIVNEGFDVELLNGALSATCDQYLIEYALTTPTIIDTTLATIQDLPTKTSDLTNDSGFITSAEIEPYHEITAPTVNTGIAKQAMSIALNDNSNKLKPNSTLAAKVKTNRDLTDKFKATMEYATYYPYNLEKYFEQTFSPALELKFCEDKIAYLAGSRPRIIYTGYMFRTGGAGFAMPCSEDGTPDGRLYETTEVRNTAVIIADQTTSLHQLTFTSRYSDPYGQVATIDGQSEQMTCWRVNALKMFIISEELANKSDLPTKTSDLTNDSGFITSADIITKRALSDFNVYVDPMANMTTTKFTVVVSYAADPTYPLFTVELTHTGGDAATWSWSRSGSNQSISIDYSSLTGKYNLHYYNLQDGGGNEHSGGMNLPLTSPYWTGEAQDDWFHFSVTSQTTTIATKEYVNGIVGNINTILDNINGEVI